MHSAGGQKGQGAQEAHRSQDHLVPPRVVVQNQGGYRGALGVVAGGVALAGADRSQHDDIPRSRGCAATAVAAATSSMTAIRKATPSRGSPFRSAGTSPACAPGAVAAAA